MVNISKRTCFQGGGLLFDKPDLTLALEASSHEGAPPLYVDNRGLLLAADNQGTTPQCAAYTMATVLEVALWRKNRSKTTIDPVPIYTEAKRIDGNDRPGTYLDSVFKAAQNLKLIGPEVSMRALRNRTDVKFAIREHEVCLLGFRITEGWNNVDKRTGFIGPDGGNQGGHAVTGCWYNDIPGAPDSGLGVGNSWGTRWGVRGFGRLTWKQFDEQFMYGLVVEGL